MNYGNPRPRVVVRHEEIPKFFDGFYYLRNWNRVYCADDGVVRAHARFNRHFDGYAFYGLDGERLEHAWRAFVSGPYTDPPTVYALRDLEGRLQRDLEAAKTRDAAIVEIDVQLERVQRTIRKGRFLL